MSHARTYLIRFGAVLLASGAALGAALGAAAGATSAATTPGSSGSSGSSSSSAVPASLAGIKAKAATDITDRLNALNRAIAKVNAAKGLGPSQATLVSYLGTDIAPLQQLNQTIQGDATVQQAGHDFGTIFSEYRVYALVLPVSRIAAGADRTTTTAVPNLTSAAAKAEARVTPTNQATLQPLLNDLNSQIAAATNAATGLATTVLAFTPAQWNADNSLLAASASSSQAANSALEKGRADVTQIVQDLKSSAVTGLRRHADTTTTTTTS